MNKKKIAIIAIIILILGIGVWLIFDFKGDNPNKIVEYLPEEEISDTQLRQTIVSLYFQSKNTDELVSEGRLIDAKLLLNEPYKTLLELLMEGPRNEKLEKLIPDGTVVNKVELKKDILYIDFSK